ncbi:LysR family transcriptional regulator [Yoonia sp.]|uniref:LysR family transcriptional regulator n=1 Tax=Yoonia sp. TaxID=2212373 RepID=UPI0023B76242
MQSRFKDWGDARVFLAVAREGSTLAAARVLGINQTTVSRRIDVLEHVLGVALFEKTTRGARTTEAGKALLTAAEALEAAALTFEALAIEQSLRDAPPIRLTAFDNAMAGSLGKIIAAFSEENPDISFEFIASERILDLCKGEADVALRLSPAIADERLIVTRLGDHAWTYYASKAYAAKNGVPKAYVDDLAPHKVALLAHISSKRRGVMRCATADDLRMAIAAGQAIGPLPTFEGDKNPNLVRCFPPPYGSTLNAFLVTSPDAHKRPMVRKFTAFAAPILRRYFKNFG